MQRKTLGRLLARLCERDLTFKWMCGGLSMNYHSLNDQKIEEGRETIH
jgi:hypothetical protein